MPNQLSLFSALIPYGPYNMSFRIWHNHSKVFWQDYFSNRSMHQNVEMWCKPVYTRLQKSFQSVKIFQNQDFDSKWCTCILIAWIKTCRFCSINELWWAYTNNINWTSKLWTQYVRNRHSIDHYNEKTNLACSPFQFEFFAWTAPFLFSAI